MPKMKTKRAAAKRFKALGSGKFKRRAAYRRHLMSSRSTKQKRRLRGVCIVDERDEVHLRRMLPYAKKG